jgi:hypothetical protein
MKRSSSSSPKTKIKKSTSVLTILIIRHAEKPGGSWPGPGLRSDGTVDDKSLVLRGWQRAGSWSALFGTGLGGKDYPTPSVVYAADPNAVTGKEPSQRPYETICSLAARLGLKPETKYALGQEGQLATAILSQTGVILVAWEHKRIVRALLPTIAKPQVIPDMPTNWDPKRFDVVLRFDRSSATGLWSFRQLCPCLLSNDPATPMS